MRRVDYGLSSPHMGGLSKWNVLANTDIGSVVPEVFAPPPQVVSGHITDDVEKTLMEGNPLIAGIIERRGLFGSAPSITTDVIQKCPTQPPGLRRNALRFLRRNLFDYFGRR